MRDLLVGVAAWHRRQNLLKLGLRLSIREISAIRLLHHYVLAHELPLLLGAGLLAGHQRQLAQVLVDCFPRVLDVSTALEQVGRWYLLLGGLALDLAHEFNSVAVEDLLLVVVATFGG